MQNKLKINTRIAFGVALFCIAGVSAGNLYAAQNKAAVSSAASSAAYNCVADSTWFSAPSLPAEVKKSGSDGSSNFCDFYQFSWQTFAYLMAPSKADAKKRNFEDTSQYYELEVTDTGAPANSCDDKHDGTHTLFVRTAKPLDGGTEFVIPERIGQAGGGATIYDQNGNVVYYDVRFSKNMCDVDGIKQKNNFPGGTTEIKIAWKVLGKGDDPSKFITMDAVIGSNKNPTKLGLVGFHIAVATPDHPEFVWATFEHDVNAPDCTSPSTTKGWSFASEKCTASLGGKASCTFNSASKQSSTTGTPTEICRVYPYGSAEGDLKYSENVGDITSLNANVQPYLTGSYAVLTNYFNVGALWLSDITQSAETSLSSSSGQNSSAQISNQRGSLRLANTVAETVFQNVDPSSTFVSNCFGCHNYVGTSFPASGKNTTSGNLSHIFDDIVAGLGQCVDVQAATVINSQQQASATCPTTCKGFSSPFVWNGQWTNQDAKTGQQLPMTVCGCCGK